MLVLKLENAGESVIRAVVFRKYEDGTVFIEDIAEGESLAVFGWFQENYGDRVTHVQLADGSFEEPDCLTTWEAAEAAIL